MHKSATLLRFLRRYRDTFLLEAENFTRVSSFSVDFPRLHFIVRKFSRSKVVDEFYRNFKFYRQLFGQVVRTCKRLDGERWGW